MPDQPPKHLRPATQKWWHEVVRDYALEEHHIRLLTLAGESWDRGQAAREQIEQDGCFYRDRFEQPRVHPGVGVAREAAVVFCRILRELDLDVEAPRHPKHPPAVGRR